LTEVINEKPLMLEWPAMPDQEMLGKIIDVVAKVGNLERDRITPDATLDSLGLESIDVVTILMDLEDVMDTYIPMNSDLASARNMAELVNEAVREMNKAAKGSEAQQ